MLRDFEEFLKDLMAFGLVLAQEHIVLVDRDEQQKLEHRVDVLFLAKRLVVQQQLEELVDVVHLVVVVRVLFEEAQVERPEEC